MPQAALSIPELIKQNRMDELRSVNLRAGSNTEATVQETDPEGVVFNNGTVFIELGTSEEKEDGPLMHDTYHQEFLIHMTVAGSDDPAQSTPRAIDDRLIRFEMDVKKALKRDYTCGGLAQNHYFKKPSTLTTIGGLPGRTMYYEVRYYTRIDQPDNQ